MTLIPFETRPGQINGAAVYSNAVLISALYRRDSGPFLEYCRTFGGRLVAFESDPATINPDFGVIISGDEALIVMAGTTNVPEWIGHAASAYWPTFDPNVPIAGGSHPLANGMIILGLGQIIERLLNAISPVSRGKLSIAGHSYGGGAAFAFGRALANVALPPSEVHIMTYGEPNVYDKIPAIKEPTSHYRLIAKAFDYGYRRSQLQDIDPVTLMPPASLTLLRWPFIFTVIFAIAGLAWGQYGEPLLLSPDGILVPVPRDFLNWPVVEVGNIAANLGNANLHFIDESYLPLSRKAWLDFEPDHRLDVFDRYYAMATGTPFVPRNVTGPAVSASVLNTNFFGSPEGPVTDATRDQWETISASGYFISNEVSSMATGRQMKGTFEQTIGLAGFSESLWAVPGAPSSPQDHGSMMRAMQALMPLRAKLSVTGTYVVDQNPMSFETIRVEDTNQLRSVLNYNPTNPISGWINQPSISQGAPQVYAANLPEDVAARVVFTNNNGLNASVYLHGIPVGGVEQAWPTVLNQAFYRQAAMNPVWLAALRTYSDAIAAQGCGFRNFVAPWTPGTPGANSTPAAVTYDAVNEQYIITTAQAPPQPGAYGPPGQKIKYVLRGFKNLPFLNGRWTGIQVPGKNAVQIQVKLRQVDWDGLNGTISPLVWGYYLPAPSANPPGGQGPGVIFAELTSKKVGRPFEQQRGRRRNTVR